MNNRPKIIALSQKELAQLLIESFFKVGRDVELSPEKLKIFLQEVYHAQGWMYVDTFNAAFSSYAACKFPEAEIGNPKVSPLFVSRLMKLYFRKCNENNNNTKLVKENNGNLSPEGKCLLFIKHITSNKCLPENPDWISIYEHLAALQKFTIPLEWNTLGYSKKLKHSMQEVSEWACKNFTINENLIYKPYTE